LAGCDVQRQMNENQILLNFYYDSKAARIAKFTKSICSVTRALSGLLFITEMFFTFQVRFQCRNLNVCLTSIFRKLQGKFEKENVSKEELHQQDLNVTVSFKLFLALIFCLKSLGANIL
jgi:hypothetical protein